MFFFDLPVWTVFIMLCVRGIGSTFQQPAIQSIIPQLVPACLCGVVFICLVLYRFRRIGECAYDPATAYIQETVAPEKMGRAFSVLTLISSVTMPIGLLFSSPIAEKIGVNMWFFVSGICMVTLIAVVVICYVRAQRRNRA